ncbi:MAG TPA: hypothetical protein VEX86_04805, partial [Longimicrobium sp.]|nr:hypothetical protein [Longimicrobium sp.]
MTTIRITGTVQSGSGEDAQPLSLPVAVYEATQDLPITRGSAVADEFGNFSIEIKAPASGNIIYAAAFSPRGIALYTVIGPQVQGAIVINELTTVAAAFAMAQFALYAIIKGDALALRIAAGMCHNLVSPLTGAASDVMLASPNRYETNSLQSLGSLGNVVAACVRGVPGALEKLKASTPLANGDLPEDTFQAMVSIALNPARNVGDIYDQTQACDAYTPALPDQSPPPLDAWTLCVKVNDSGDIHRMFGGPANIAFDKAGYAWVANNVIQGTPNSAKWIMVLQPDGKPADGRDGTPVSPISGGGILGVGFGVAIAPPDG